MYDTNSSSLLPHGFLISDLSRTGAAALSHRLEGGDERLSINDKTLSRLLSFLDEIIDEIMDFVIEADPEDVNIFVCRPYKETLQAHNGTKTPSVNKDSSAGVKWWADERRSKRKYTRKPTDTEKEKRSSLRSKIEEDGEDESEDREYHSKKTRRGRKDPYESQSYLDILIDTICACANPDSFCGEIRRPGEREGSYSDEDDAPDLIYESEADTERKKKKKGLFGGLFGGKKGKKSKDICACANPDNICGEMPRPGEEEDYYSDEDDGTFASRDDFTDLTDESEADTKKKKNGLFRGLFVAKQSKRRARTPQ
jgi:hypothetical protein